MVECSALFRQSEQFITPQEQRRLVVTQGDPAGIGPELLLRVGDAGVLRPGDRVVADREVLEGLVRALGTPWAARGLSALEPHLAPNAGPLGQVAALVAGVD